VDDTVTGRENTDKLPLSYIMDAPKAVHMFAQIMQHGESKYGKVNDRNTWLHERGYSESEIIDSLLGHLLARKNGEIRDQESGVDHYAHALANIVFLAELFGVEEFAGRRPAAAPGPDQVDPGRATRATNTDESRKREIEELRRMSQLDGPPVP
jgi:hypothetical protein